MDNDRPARGPGAAHEQRRGAILEAVFTIVDTTGTDQVTIRNVAAAAGVSIGRVQHYFPTKDDLLAAAFTAINDRGTARVHQRLSDNAADPHEVLNVVLGVLIPDSDEDCRLVRVAQAFEAYAHSRPPLKDRLTQGYRELADLFTYLLNAGVHRRADQVSPLPHTAAYELLALATGLAGLVITHNLTPPQAHDIATTRLDQLLDASRTRPQRR